MRPLLIAATLLALAVGAVAPAQPTKADSDPDLEFGAAITAVFNQSCRPVNGVATFTAIAVLGGMTKQARAAALTRAERLKAKMSPVAFCQLFEDSIQRVED
jgi:hypothetical protein